MKTNSRVWLDRAKRRVYLVLEGFHDVEEASRMRDLYKEAVMSMPSGFTVLADVSGYKPGAKEVQAVHAEAVRAAEERGVRRVARVVGRTPLGGMQIERVARDASYEAASFATRAEAEAFLDEE